MLPQSYETVGSGNFNLFFPFFEAAWRRLDDQGEAVFITPNGFFTSLSGKPLRTWFASTQFLDTVVDFGSARVFDAMTYTAVTFMSKKMRTDVSSLQYLMAASAETIPADLVKAANTVVLPASGASWMMVEKKKQNLIDAVSSQPYKFSDVCTMTFGLATLRDKLYQLSGEQNSKGNYVTSYLGEDYEVEPGITMPCVKLAGVENETKLRMDKGRIVYPYVLATDTVSGKQRAEVITEEELRELYPRAYEYLLALRPELALRDNGKKQYPAWYAYGRSQATVPLGYKLLAPLYAGTPRFMYSDKTDTLFLNGVAVTINLNGEWGVGGAEEKLRLVQALLNSSVCKEYVEATGVAITGGYYAYQKAQLKDFGLPDISRAQAVELAAVSGPERDSLIRALYGVEKA